MPAPVSIPARRGWIVVPLIIGVALDYVVFRCHAQIALFGMIILSVLAAVFTLGPLYQLIRPRPFATFTDRGLAFPILNIREIPWSRILDAQVGPKSRTHGRQTTVYLRRPLVLKLTAAGAPASLLESSSMVVTEAEGTEQRLIAMAYCPISTEEFIARLARWRPVASARHLADPTNAFAPAPETNKRIRRNAVFLSLFGVIFMTVGGCVGLQTVRARTWPTTSGIVLSSTMTSTTSTDGTTYSPVIVYRYQVAGHDYTGRRYAISHPSTADAVRAILARYPAGATTNVYYDPANPSSAVLAQSPLSFSLVFVTVGAVALCAGVLLRRKT